MGAYPVCSLWSVLLGVIMLGGALGPGYVLSYDMVWVPELTVRSDFWGTGSALPRAVPSDLVVALLDEVVPGMLLQKAVLLGALVVAGSGAARLVPGTGLVGPLAATTIYVWNPFVVERLGIGHWPLLLTYASLPWIHLCARRLASGGAALPQLVLWLAVASLSPVGGLVAGTLAVTAVAVSGRAVLGALWRTGAAVAAVNAPWVVAGAIRGSGSVSDPGAVTLFAAQGEGVMPAWAAVMGLGGIWNAEVVPTSRTTWIGVAALVLVLAVCAAGLTTWRRCSPRADRRALVVVAVVGVVVALAGTLAPDGVEWLASRVPGAGLLRDGTRFVALVAPLQAVLFGLGAARLAGAVPARAIGTGVATLLVLAPVALMPDAAGGLSGRLGAVDFPAEYAVAREAVETGGRSDRTGDVLLLPFTTYRQPEWNDRRRTLDPLGRYLPWDYLASDTLVVSGREIAGEDQRARRVEQDLGTLTGSDLEQALASEGIEWVVLDREAAAALEAQGVDVAEQGGAVDLDGARVVHRGSLLTVWELEPSTRPVVRGPADTLVAHLLLALAWVLASLTVAGAAYRSVRSRSTDRRQLRGSG